jgi:voltage-gated potassium channel
MTADSWRKHTEWPLAGVAVVFLVAYSIEVIANVPERSAGVFDIIIWITWGVFLIDYVVTLILQERRARWFVRNLHEVVILALPMVRPLRLMRLLTVMRFSHRFAGSRLRGRIITYAIALTILLVYVGALAALDAEQNHPGSNIRSIGNALWWAVSTVTGTGFGDYYPVTFVGKLVGVGLMAGGIALVGVVAASLAAWMIDQVGNRVVVAAEDAEEAAEQAEAAVEHAEREESDARSEVARLSEQVARLTALLEARLPAEASSSPVD